MAFESIEAKHRALDLVILGGEEHRERPFRLKYSFLDQALSASTSIFHGSDALVVGKVMKSGMGVALHAITRPTQ